MKVVKGIILSFIIIGSWCIFPLKSAEIPNFHFRKYQVDQGLSENTVTTIMQDKKGFLWLGTKDGLNKFDGNTFKIYRSQEAPNTLGNNFIKSILEGKNNEMYIGTDEGLYIMDLIHETFERLEKRMNVEDKIITSVTSLLLDNEGNVWITTMTEGVYVYNPEKGELKRVKLRDYDLRKTSIWTVYQDKSGIIWVGTRIGLLQYNPGNQMLEPVEGLVEFGNNFSKEILTIFEGVRGNLWLGTWANGIINYNKQQQGFSTFCGSGSTDYYISHIRAFLQYDAEHIMVGADDGLYLFNTSSRQTSRVDIPYDRYSLGDQNVYSLWRDHEGGIWVGTYFGGLNYLNTSILGFEQYLPNNKPGYLSGKAISQFCEDQKGNLWIATEDGGLNYFDTHTKTFSQPVKTSYHNIHPLLLAGNNLWIGTFSRGIDVYNTQTRQMKHYRNTPSEKSINDDCIFSLYQTRAGDIYVGTTAGLNKYNPQTDDFTRIKDDSIVFVYDIIEDAYRNLWIASYKNGLSRKDGRTGKWIFYNEILPETDPLVNSKLTGLYIDSNKRLWLSSEGRGLFLYQYQDDTFINISEKDSLPNNVVYGILDDLYGNIWVSSNQGLVSFPWNNIHAQKRFTQADGLQSNEFNFKSSYKASDGKLYFGGINGFNCFYPQDLTENINTIISNVEITGLSLLGEKNPELDTEILAKLNKKEPLILKYNNASFSISFVSLSYIAQSKNQYAYKLDGADENWNQIGNNRNVTYLNLAPGKYTFKVKATNNHGIWNHTGAELKFEILPPFWRTWVAKVIYYVVLLLIIAATIIYFILRNRAKQEKVLEHFKAEQEKQAFKSKIDFFTNIAHEIRTPVSLIKAPLEEILMSKDGSENTRTNLSIIEKNSDRLNVLINQLLDFRKMDSDEYAINAMSISLKKHITELYERFRKTAQRNNIDFILELPTDDNLTVITDPDAITKITGNFLTNAMKFTRTEIILRLVKQPDNSLVISVTDNGKGIPEEMHNRVFDPFYQIKTSEKKPGAGIGLFLAKHLAEILEGDITISHNPEGGAIFSFAFRSLPESVLKPLPPVQENNNEPEPFTDAETDGQYSVLIVEDNTDMLGFIENSLKTHYLTDTAENAPQALLRLDKNNYDIIITDIMMPDIDGIEFTRQLRQNVNYSHIPILLLSAKTDNHTKIEGLSAGADVFIEKPFSTSYLKAQISSLLANRKAIMEAFNRSPLTSYSILTTNKSDQEFLTRLNTEIDKHISDIHFSIESLTNQLFISRSNFQRKLKSICGYTPGDYLRTYRLKKAAGLLMENGLRINEVAFEVGFNSASYFTKCFVKQFGLLPKDFVQKNSKKEDDENQE